MNILLLENNERSAYQTHSTLKRLVDGVSVRWVKTVDEGLTALGDAGGARFSALLFDLGSDQEGARSLVAQAGRRDLLRQLAVIAISEDDTDLSRATALARDAHGFLPKPLDPKRLREMLTKRRLYWELRELPSKLDDYWRQRAGAVARVRDRETA